jgi:hypothetical protein
VCEIKTRNEYTKQKALDAYYKWYKQGIWVNNQKFWVSNKEGSSNQIKMKVLNAATTCVLSVFDFGSGSKILKTRAEPYKLVVNDKLVLLCSFDSGTQQCQLETLDPQIKEALIDKFADFFVAAIASFQQKKLLSQYGDNTRAKIDLEDQIMDAYPWQVKIRLSESTDEELDILHRADLKESAQGTQFDQRAGGKSSGKGAWQNQGQGQESSWGASSSSYWQRTQQAASSAWDPVYAQDSWQGQSSSRPMHQQQQQQQQQQSVSTSAALTQPRHGEWSDEGWKQWLGASLPGY